MNQIILLGTPYIQRELEQSLHSFEDICIIQERKKDCSKPILYLYCGDCKEDRNKYSTTFLKELVEKQLVLPVVKDPKLFNAYIPEELGSINAIIIPSGNEVNKLKNRVLEWFGKIEVNRKIFISYKRSDSTVLAQQLYNALIKAHYIPFLDSYSIDSGVAFQEYLLHELSDSAVFLFINTPKYDMSKFTMEELNAASNHSIFRHDNFIGCFSADKIKKSVRKYFCFNIPVYKNMAEEPSCRSYYHEEYIQTSASGNPEDLCH